MRTVVAKELSAEEIADLLKKPAFDQVTLGPGARASSSPIAEEEERAEDGDATETRSVAVRRPADVRSSSGVRRIVAVP